MRTAAMVGASGLVGSALVTALLNDQRFGKVLTFGRRASGPSHPKAQHHAIDFDAPDSWSALVKGDVAFSCLGTTLKQAGGQAPQWKVDYDYQLAFAKAAAMNRIPSYVLVSAASADPSSRLFYSRMKGELDAAVQQLGFERVAIMRPSLLRGDRKQPRLGEKISSAVLGVVNAIGIARTYREISADVVAQAMINAALHSEEGTRIITLDEIFAEADRLV